MVSNSYHSFSDAELLNLLKLEDDAAYNELHDRYFDLLFRSAYNMLRDENACMDVLQDVFVWFWEHRQQIKVTSVKGYLLMAVKYRMASYIRSAKVREGFLLRVEALNIDATFVEDSLELKELKEIIAGFIGTLPPVCGQVFHMSRQEHLSNKEIAEKLGISEKTVEAHITLALKKLKISLGKLNYLLFFFL